MLLGTNNLIRARRSGVDPALVLDLVGTANRFTDTGAAIPANVGDAVAAWRSTVATPITVTQPTLEARPAAGTLGLTFDGGDWLEAADRAALRFGGSNPWTLVVWAFPTTLDGAPAQNIVTKWGSTTALQEAQLWMDGFNASIGVRRVGGGFSTVSVAVPNANNAWHFITATYNGAELLSISRNAGTPNSVTVSGGLQAANTEPFRVGRTAAGGFWNGSVGSVRIWHRALSAAEIAALWTAERGIYGV